MNWDNFMLTRGVYLERWKKPHWAELRWMYVQFTPSTCISDTLQPYSYRRRQISKGGWHQHIHHNREIDIVQEVMRGFYLSRIDPKVRGREQEYRNRASGKTLHVSGPFSPFEYRLLMPRDKTFLDEQIETYNILRRHPYINRCHVPCCYEQKQCFHHLLTESHPHSGHDDNDIRSNVPFQLFRGVSDGARKADDRILPQLEPQVFTSQVNQEVDSDFVMVQDSLEILSSGNGSLMYSFIIAKLT